MEELTGASPTTTQDDDLQAISTTKPNNKVVIGFIGGLVLLVALIAVSAYWLLRNPGQTTTIRDIFIIFMALESLLLGIALIILIVQLARLINLLQNEIKPILNSTNDTVNTLKGTTTFLSNNLVEPVMKLNEYLAGFQKLLQIAGLTKKKKL
jgi:membrane protein implicated in regulation of membrane protease activity